MSAKKYSNLSPDIMAQLRDEMNDGLIYLLYSDYMDKNMWNIICSAMDWIQTAIDGISPDKVNNATDLEAARQMIMVVSCLELLRQGVEKLQCVFNVNRKNKFTKVFLRDQLQIHDDSGNKSIYFNIHIDKDDEYFDTIRSCFVAHPVELNDYFTSGKKEKRYASWTNRDFLASDSCSVYLYSNEPNKPPIMLTVYLDELMAYANQRYEYLNAIMDEAKQKSKKYIELFSGKILAKAPEVSEQWDELANIIRKHNGTDDILKDYEFVNLELLFKTQIANPDNAKLVNIYRSLIHKCVSLHYKDDNLKKINSNFIFSAENLWMYPSKLLPSYQRFCNLLFWEQIYFCGNLLYMSDCSENAREINDELNDLEWTVHEWIVEHLDGIIKLEEKQDMKFLYYLDKKELYVLAQVGLFFKENIYLLPKKMGLIPNIN